MATVGTMVTILQTEKLITTIDNLEGTIRSLEKAVTNLGDSITQLKDDLEYIADQFTPGHGNPGNSLTALDILGALGAIAGIIAVVAAFPVEASMVTAAAVAALATWLSDKVMDFIWDLLGEAWRSMIQNSKPSEPKEGMPGNEQGENTVPFGETAAFWGYGDTATYPAGIGLGYGFGVSGETVLGSTVTPYGELMGLTNPSGYTGDEGLTALDSAVTPIGEWLIIYWEGIKTELLAIWETLRDEDLPETWKGIRKALEKAVTPVGEWLTTYWEGIRADLLAIWETMRDKDLPKIWEAIGATAAAKWGEISESIRREIHGIITEIDGLKSTLDSIKSSAKAAAKEVSAAEKAVRTAGLTGLSEALATSPVPASPPPVNRAVSGFKPMASGGIVTRPTLALLGEAGPEAVLPLRGAGAGVGGINVTMHVHGSVGVKDIAEQLVREIRLKTGVRF